MPGITSSAGWDGYRPVVIIGWLRGFFFLGKQVMTKVRSLFFFLGLFTFPKSLIIFASVRETAQLHDLDRHI